jgi:hypothetical protein
MYSTRATFWVALPGVKNEIVPLGTFILLVVVNEYGIQKPLPPTVDVPALTLSIRNFSAMD